MVKLRRLFDPTWHRYLGHRLGQDKLVVGGVVALALLAIGGALTVRALVGTGESQAATFVPLTTTVLRRVKVVEHGRTVYKRVPVVKRVLARPVTVQQTRTVETPGGTRVVTGQVVRYRPVYRRRVVLVHGKPVTVARVVTDTRMLTDTQSLTVTHEHTSTLVNDRTVVTQQTVNQTQTINQTVTNVRTQTLPAETVTVTGPTHTEVVTTTVASTVTVETPRITITVTVPEG
jgi:hypothetical protein